MQTPGRAPAFGPVFALGGTAALATVGLALALAGRPGWEVAARAADGAQPDGASYTCPATAEELRERLTPPLTSYDEAFHGFNLDVQNVLIHKCYVAPEGWVRDIRVRDTGPMVDGEAYGVHPAVRIYYSPEVHAWLEAGRTGTLPDGAIIIKEQYPPPASGWADLGALPACPAYGWSVMIKRQAGSKDGWFWGGYSPPPNGGCGPGAPDATRAPEAAGAPPPPDAYPFASYPYGAFGQVNGCMRCHVAAAQESTFAALRNIVGTPDPVQYLMTPPRLAAPPTPPRLRARLSPHAPPSMPASWRSSRRSRRTRRIPSGSRCPR